MKLSLILIRLASLSVCFLLAACGNKDSAKTIVSSTNATVFSAHNALALNGAVYTWGYNGYGQLGNGTSTNATSPAAVPGLPRMNGAAAGGTHTLAFKNMSGVWAWGNNGHGQLGDSTINASSTPVKVAVDTAGTLLSNIAAVAAGAYHSLALGADGTVWSWGANYSGQLGDGTTVGRSVAQRIGLADVVQIAAGGSHSLALLGDRTVRAWGLNHVGQLGNGSIANSLLPVQVLKEDGSPLQDIVAIAAGGGHNLAVDGSGGVWAWGNNSLGQLGKGSWANQVIDIPYTTHAVQVAGIPGAKAVAAGLVHSVVVASDGSVMGWGSNFYGQVGDGANTQGVSPIITPTKVVIPGGAVLNGISNVSATGNHTVGFTGGAFRTWGDNLFGQLGVQTPTSSSSFALELNIP